MKKALTTLHIYLSDFMLLFYPGANEDKELVEWWKIALFIGFVVGAVIVGSQLKEI